MSKGITTKDYWDAYWGSGEPRYPAYDKSRGVYHSYGLLLTDCIARTTTRLGREPRTIVDCGCGEGLLMRFIHEHSPALDVWGIDYSDAIEKARQMGDHLNYDFHLVRGDLFEVCRPGGAGPFDMLISGGLLEHFADPGQVLAQLSQAVNPGGCVITVIPNFEGLAHFLWKLYDPANYGHHIPISEARLLEIHRDLGLEDVSFYTMGTPLIPGIHATPLRWQRALNWLIAQVNGRILQRLWPRQTSLSRRFPMTPTVACVGWKPSPGQAALKPS